MNKLIQQLIKERRVTLFLAVVIAVVGAYSYYLLPRQENPDVSVPVAMIITPYPGASPNDVKELVTSKIEDELAELDGYDKTIGVSKEGVSIVVVMFQDYVDSDKALQDVRNAVVDVQSDMPGGALPSQVDTDLIDTAGIIISLSGENYTYEQLASFGELFEDKLASIEGISKFSIEGELDKEVKVDIDVAKLNQLGISIVDISQILQAQNIEIPSGNIKYGDTKITVKTPGIYTSLDDIRNTIIGVSSQTGIVTKLSDVADVYMDLEEDAQKYKQNGKNAVLLTGYFQKGKNIVIVGKDVRTAIDEVKAALPEDLIVEEVIYQPDDVSKSVNDFMMNLIEGIILVIIVVFLGMGLRNALVVSTAIPLSVLITFGVMFLMGIEIHQMSLTALIISLGVLVDNAIVISDTIQVRMDQGEEKLDAAYNGTTVSSIPIFTATLTTIAAFSPLLGLPGAAGKFISAIPIVLIISIIAAYLVAMFVTPAMAAVLFKKSKVKEDKKNKIKKFFYNMLQFALGRKALVVGVMIAAFVCTVVILMPQLPSQFFPYTDKNIFYIEIESEVPGNIEATEKLTDEVVNLLSNEPEITSYTVAIGTGMPKFYVTMKPAMPSADFGQMVCKFDLGDKKERRFKNKEEFVDYIQKKLDENIANGHTSARLLANAKPVEAKAIVKVSGENLDRLREVADTLKKEIATIPGTTNVRHDMKDKSLQLQIEVDKEKASSFGITQYDIQRQVNMALYGNKASVYRRGGNEYNIRLKSNINSVSELENMGIKSSATNKKVPLKQFAAVTHERKMDGINTYKRKQTVEILINELPGYSPIEIENIIENEILPKVDTSGTTISFHGEREDISENFSIVGILALLCVFIIYVILLIQFNSFIQPVVILLTVPLSLIGSIAGLYLMNNPLSLTAFLGIIALIGLVVKNGILLIEYINDARKQGCSIEEACIDAVDKRFNAIILSATTTVVGLIPLALSGSSLFGPMAIALMSGLIVSTFLTMVVIPVVYSIFEGFIENWKKKRGLKTELTVE
ncbi:multidrug efflux pump subunit AcrB [Anaerosolibacter carboniphilus]|uniref:Multidrug efflux pump subunit AcrB n=1 Tax=Anaerosolibacter carboniphilus TaxID=1417629 RepID=A0A841KPE2_9FIRM|nr:efflux RND transporter permease subunit [Anaerosolibacter carboniphilus]MBB6213970.1 multidrug efflux pump subunit AcrB [Anaerosolibacter carboniphilus]